MKNQIIAAFLSDIADINSGFVKHMQVDSIHHNINNTRSIYYSGSFIEKNSILDAIEKLIEEGLIGTSSEGSYLTTKGVRFLREELVAKAA